MKKRIGALVIMLAMLLTLIPMNAYAENKGGALMCQEVGYDDWWRVIVNESNPLLESYLLDGTEEIYLFFYFLDEDGNKEFVTADKLEASVDSVIISENDSNANATTLRFPEMKDTVISYKAEDGSVYTLDMNVVVPDLGFYSAPEATKENLISTFYITDKNNIFYFIAKDGWTISEFELDGAFYEDECNVSINEDKTVITIELTGDKNDCGFSFLYSAVNEETSETIEEQTKMVWVYSYRTALKYAAMMFTPDGLADMDMIILESEACGEAGAWNAFFYFVNENGITPLSYTDLVINDPEIIVSISQSEYHEDAVFMEIKSVGVTSISCIVDGKTYTIPMEIDDAGLGVVSDINDISNSYVGKLHVTEENNVFYLVGDRYEFSEAFVNEEYQEFISLEYSEDDSYIKVIIDKEAPSGKVVFDLVEDIYSIELVNHICYHKNTEVQNKKDVTCEEDGYTGDKVCKDCGETLEEGEEIPAEGHKNTEVQNKKDVTCKEDGYTGDTVCKDCGDTLEKGEVIPAKNHKNTEVQNKKDVTCEEDGYTGDTVCKDCGDTVVKGEVIPAIGHNYKDLVCTNCGEKIVASEKVEEVDPSEPVEEVTPVVKQEALDTTADELMNIVESIVADKVVENLNDIIAEETVEEIKKEVEAGNKIVTEIVANTVTKEEVKAEAIKEIETVLGEQGKVAQYLDLSVVIKSVQADGQKKELGNLNELNNKISFTVVIPEDLKEEGRTFYVIRVHNGKTDKLDVTKNADGTYSFETDRFSTYALAYEDVDKIIEEGDINGAGLLFTMISFVAVSMLLVLRKRVVNR